MMKQTENKPLGVIEILSGGFAMIVRRPWVLLIPIALDLFLWFGPSITAEPVLRPLFSSLSLPAGMTADAAKNFDELKHALETGTAHFNVFTFLTLLAFGMPSLVGAVDAESACIPARATWLTLNNGVGLFALAVVLVLVGVLLASVYLEAVARGVRRESGGALVGRAVKAWLNVLALLVLGLLAFMVLMIPFSIIAVLASLINQGVGAFVLMLGMVILLWTALYLAFTIPAIFVGGLNVRQAALNSIAIFRFNGRSALILLFLIYLLQIGFAVVWENLLVNVWGLAFDIVANAFLGSGLIAAVMLFYYDRVNWLAQWQAQARKAATPPVKS
ncbi:MAG: hypothetical protein HY868_15245 [Chloroflexi bacterium]|nr:hypothetical protein [Chloroflexota bacterium]